MRPVLPLVILDLESTGSDPLNHAIVSIAAVDLRVQRRREFASEVRAFPGAELDRQHATARALPLEDLEKVDRPDEAEVIPAFLKWLGSESVMLGGINTRSNRDFLLCALRRVCARQHCSLRLPVVHRSVDLGVLTLLHAQAHGLANPMTTFNDTLSRAPHPAPHAGILGARLIAKTIVRLLNAAEKDEPRWDTGPGSLTYLPAA